MNTMSQSSMTISTSGPDNAAKPTERPTHSPIGASSAERWWNCPGSVPALAKIPKSGDTIYSATGTVAHMLGERQIINKVEAAKAQRGIGVIPPYPSLEQELGRSYVEGGFEIEVTEDMVNAVEVYVQTISDYVDEYNLSWAQDVRVEVGFEISCVDPQAYGTCDAVLVVPMNRIIVIDYKHGQGHIVEVDDNHQFLYYALGAYYELPEIERADLAYVEICVVQPRAKHDLGGIRSAVYPIQRLMDFERELRGAVARIRAGDNTLAAGKWCKFCDAKPVCREHVEHLQRLSGVDLRPVAFGAISLPDPSKLSPEQLSNILSNASALKDWASSALAYGHRLVEAGQKIPGYKLVEKKSNRRWIKEVDVEAAFELEFGDEIYTKKLKSPAQLEKLLKSKRKHELEPYYETPPSGKTLVREDDGRAEVRPDALTDFEPLLD